MSGKTSDAWARAWRVAGRLAGTVLLACGASAAMVSPAGASDGIEILTPAEGEILPEGWVGPIVVDFGSAPTGWYYFSVTCGESGGSGNAEGGYDYHATSGDTAILNDGVNPGTSIETIGPLPASKSCHVGLGSETAFGVGAGASFRVDGPPPTLSVLSQSPSTFYPTVHDGYRDTTTTRFAVDRKAFLAVRVLNSAGRTIRSVELGMHSAGARTWTWNGRNNSGSHAPTGRYRVEVAATTDYGKTAAVSARVDIASGNVTRSARVVVDGRNARAATRGKCKVTRTTKTADLECWGGQHATTTYRVSLPRNARKVAWSVKGARPDNDFAGNGVITRSGTRVDARHFVVKVRVTRWRAYNVRSVVVSWRYRAHI